MDTKPIMVGARANDETGDDLRSAFITINANTSLMAAMIDDLMTAVAETAAAAREARAVAIGRARIGRTPVDDRDFVAGSGDVLVAFTRMTAPRACTLPRASDFVDGQPFTVVDEGGFCSPDRPLRLVAAYGDTISGAPSFVVGSAYAKVILHSNGRDLWTY